jgi:periplasmic protein TonB
MAGFDDIVFNHRNKDYGAFDLRRRYPKVLGFSIIGSVIVFFLFFIFLQIGVKSHVKKLAESWYSYSVTNAGLNKVPEKKTPLQQSNGGLLIPDLPPKVVDSIPMSDTIRNSADGNGKDTTGHGSGNGTGDGQVFYSVQQPPVFPGGDNERIRFLQRNINYPPEARNKNIHGKVYIAFIVEKNGKITNTRLLQGIGHGCDEEALRVVQSMPQWDPGRQNGMAVRVHIVWPIVF